MSRKHSAHTFQVQQLLKAVTDYIKAPGFDTEELVRDYGIIIRPGEVNDIESGQHFRNLAEWADFTVTQEGLDDVDDEDDRISRRYYDE